MTNTLPEADAATPGPDTRGGWIRLTLVGCFTVLLLLVGLEVAARKLYSRSKTTLLDCLVLRDPATGVRGIPNCRVSEKWEETRMADYRLNDCGDRTDMPCGVKQPGTYRIVLMGSSIAAGLRVPQNDTFATLLPTELSARSGKKVELYSVAMRTETPRVVDLRINKALAQKPDLILWAVTAYDVGRPDDLINDAAKPAASQSTHASRFESLEQDVRDESQVFHSEPASQFVLDLWNKTRMSFMVQHLLYENQSLYVNAFLRQSDAAAGYLRPELSPAWQEDLRHFDGYLADVQARAHAAGVPLVVALVPARAHAGLLSMQERPAGSDPFTFDKALRDVVLRSGASYLDTLPAFQNLPHATRYYFPVETHPNQTGQRFLAKTLADGLASGIAPELTVPQAGGSSARFAR